MPFLFVLVFCLLCSFKGAWLWRYEHFEPCLGRQSATYQPSPNLIVARWRYLYMPWMWIWSKMSSNMTKTHPHRQHSSKPFKLCKKLRKFSKMDWCLPIFFIFRSVCFPQDYYFIIYSCLQVLKSLVRLPEVN